MTTRTPTIPKARLTTTGPPSGTSANADDDIGKCSSPYKQRTEQCTGSASDSLAESVDRSRTCKGGACAAQAHAHAAAAALLLLDVSGSRTSGRAARLPFQGALRPSCCAARSAVAPYESACRMIGIHARSGSVLDTRLKYSLDLHDADAVQVRAELGARAGPALRSLKPLIRGDATDDGGLNEARPSGLFGSLCEVPATSNGASHSTMQLHAILCTTTRMSANQRPVASCQDAEQHLKHRSPHERVSRSRHAAAVM